jgi:hypothetical protein
MKQIYNAVLYLLLNFNINFASFGLNLGLDLDLNSGPRQSFYHVYQNKIVPRFSVSRFGATIPEQFYFFLLFSFWQKARRSKRSLLVFMKGLG